MIHEERWNEKYKDVVGFIKTTRRNPSNHDLEEWNKYCYRIKHNKKLMKAGSLKPVRCEMFENLLVLCEEYKRVNQYM